MSWRWPVRVALVTTAMALAAPPASASPAAFARQELLEALNAARLAGCADRPGNATGLRWNNQLAAAASGVASGDKLDGAMSRAGYRATRANTIWLRGIDGASATARAVATNYCAALVEPEFQDIGIHQRGLQTWIVLAAPFAPVAATQATEVAQSVLSLINAARSEPRQCGARQLPSAAPLRLNDTLTTVALAHASDMANKSYFNHTGQDGSQPADRVTRGGYRWRAVGENIAAGPATPEIAVRGWLRSPPHCATLMSARFTEMGVAFAVNPASAGGIYWVQVFGAPR